MKRRTPPRLPYGIWRTSDGREVVFDRHYRPMWQRTPGNRSAAADPAEQVDFVAQRWFWTGSTPKRERIAATAAALAEWSASP